MIEQIGAMLEGAGAVVEDGYPARWWTALSPPALYLIHWPEMIFSGSKGGAGLAARIAAVLVNLALLRLQGCRVLWIVHNVRPHDLPRSRELAWRFYAAGLSRVVSGWLTLAPSTRSSVAQALPALGRKPHTYVWHPPYDGGARTDRVRARAQLSLPHASLVAGHIGLLRPYKNLECLVGTFGHGGAGDTLLLVAGNPLPADYGDALKRAAGADPRACIKTGFLDEEAFDLHLSALDVFIAPYAQYLHSGALVHALCRDCVLVAPNSPFARDLRDAVGSAWVVLYEDALTSDVLDEARTNVETNRGASPDLSELRPANNIHRLRALLDELGFGGGPTRQPIEARATREQP